LCIPKIFWFGQPKENVRKPKTNKKQTQKNTRNQAESFLGIRVPEDLKEAIKQAADEENITFTEWIEQTLRAALTRPKHEPKERRG
jgi:predicted HicB family RNase H-like nuclease